MRRPLVFALLFSLSHASVAIAGETLLEAASRIAREQARTLAGPTPPAIRKTRGDAARSGLQAPQGQPALETAGLGKGRKIAIALGIVAGFVGILYAIDHSVEDNTPSSLGQR